MKKLAEFIVNKRKLFVVLFALLAVAGGVAGMFVKVNYDMAAYLPKDSDVTKAMRIMNSEFGEKGTLSAMMSGLTLTEALEVKAEIEDIDGVDGVIWLDNALLGGKEGMGMGEMPDDQFLARVFGLIQDPQQLAALDPQLQVMLSQMVAGFFEDGNALYQVTFKGTAYDAATINAVNEIKDIRKVSMSGQTASSYAMQSAIQKQITLALIIIVPILLLILFLATSSYFDPVVFIVVLAVSVLISMGTNLFMGSISYLTNSVAILLQVAISMDYSIFFLHRFKEARKEGLSAREAAAVAFKKAFTSVSASSLTTIASFAAMLFMRYSVGFDMGLVLGKGIIISLLTVFFFMPGFVVMTSKAMDKGEHRSFLSLFRKRSKSAHPAPEEATPLEASAPKPLFRDRFAGGVLKARFVVPILFVLLIVPAYFLQSSNNFQYGELASAGGKGSDLEVERAAVEEVFGSQNNAVILLDKSIYGDAQIAGLTVKLSQLTVGGKNYILSAQSLPLLMQMSALTGGVPEYLREQLETENYSRIILTVDTDEESETAFAVADSIRETVTQELGTGGGYYFLGSTISTQELKQINIDDFYLVTLLTLGFIMVILFISFRGIVLPLLLGTVIQSAIWFNMAIPFILGEPLVFLGYLIVSCVQMGSTIDYGILMSANYAEARKTMGKIDAGKRAFLSSIGPVTTSAAILATVGFAVAISGITAATSSLGLLLGRGTIISHILMMFVLPMILVLFDKPIQWTTFGNKRKKAGQSAGEKGTEL